MLFELVLRRGFRRQILSILNVACLRSAVQCIVAGQQGAMYIIFYCGGVGKYDYRAEFQHTLTKDLLERIRRKFPFSKM